MLRELELRMFGNISWPGESGCVVKLRQWVRGRAKVTYYVEQLVSAWYTVSEVCR